MKSLVSVIIPAYNAEKTIEKCLNSIRFQSYKNLEIIVVNDGSTDNTEKIVSRLAQIDNRLKVITIPNGGVSNARNTGIDRATGDYITFVDSDDTIDKNMYEILVALFSKYDIDIAHCSYNTVFPDGSSCPVGNNGKEVLLSQDEAVECLISGKLFASGLWNKLYKRELFDGVRLEKDIKFCEDGLMNFYLFRKANSSVYTDKSFYNYYQCETSATHTANRLKSAQDGYRVSEIMYKNSIGKPYEEVAKRRFIGSKLGLYGTYSLNKSFTTKAERKALEQEIVQWKHQGFYNRNDRIKFAMFRYVPGVYRLLYKIYDKIRVKKLDPEQKVN